MKTDVVDVSETKKNLVVEIPSAVVDGEIDRLARRYSRAARIPGFRPGKVPPALAKQRFRDQILHDVAHELIPKAVDEALRERGLEPVATPEITGVTVEHGQPLRFTATFETLPAIDPGDYATLSLRKPPVRVEDADIDRAMQQLRERAARYEPVVGRSVDRGDILSASLDRRPLTGPAASRAPEHRDSIVIELGAPANPPGFDDELIGMAIGQTRTFTVRYPEDYAVEDLAGSDVEYTVTVSDIKQRTLPDLDDEFARDLEFESLAEFRGRVRDDLVRQAEQDANERLRGDLLKELAGRVAHAVPDALVERELDRRVEELARRLMEQRVDPRTAEIDWAAFRESQRESATDAVRSTLVLDEIARRESLVATEEDIDREIQRYGERTERTPTAVRAQLEKEGGMSRLYTGLRREKTIDFLLSHAKIAAE
ncbi:MAG: trigger factor [Acidobacteria bacterium]|nr:trigger factor [Acidobacteriota bacterium]